jgi:uncharacterized protein (DUF433 family)
MALDTKDLNMAPISTAVSPTAIKKTPGVQGGDACIGNTRISVWGLVSWRRLGLSDPEIIREVHGLTQPDLDAAWEYYRLHPSEIDDAIRENESGDGDDAR